MQGQHLLHRDHDRVPVLGLDLLGDPELLVGVLDLGLDFLG